MNAPTQQPVAPAANSGKMLRAMVGIGILCGLLIVLTYEGTLPIIEANRVDALEQAIFRVVPGTEQTQTFRWAENEGFKPVNGGTAAGEELVYAGYDASGQLLGLAIPTSGQGYADVIRILYGYDPGKQTVTGFYVLESKETPGLGDKIEKDPAFLANFEALEVPLNADGSAIANPIRPVKSGEGTEPWEIDCITGATISSRAIGEMIGASTARWAPVIQRHFADFSIANN